MDKPRLVRVPDEDVDKLADLGGMLDTPWLHPGASGSWFADPDELRAWRLQNTSGVVK